MTPEDILKAGLAVMQKKQQDYASDPSVNRYENFERAGVVGGWFNDPVHKAFAVLIGVKLARLGSLLSENKKPNHESIDDTFMDLANYAALFGGFVSAQMSQTKPITIPTTNA